MDEAQNIEDLFLRKKPVRLLLSIKMGSAPKYVSILAKEIDCTYSHTVKLLEMFKDLGIVEFDKTGRIKYITLTAEGTDLSERFENVLRKFSKMKGKK
ncbi:MAG: hypothetical protein HY832_01535 [Candidatus Aenigmarchaeota archaeon]|nr:hypothetical protein [Candidatus Aenigmarchaeota archaeon]